MRFPRSRCVQRGMFFFLIIAIIIASIIYSVHKSKQLDASWSAVANMLRLSYRPAGFMQERRLSGSIDGCEVFIETFKRGSGKSSRKFTRYSILYPRAIGLPFIICREGFMNGLSKAFGAQDVEVGDPSFDDLVMIKSSNPPVLIQYLTPDLREKIRYAIAEFAELEITQTGIRSEQPGEEASQQILVNKIQRMLAFAQSMANHSVTSEKPKISLPTFRNDSDTRREPGVPPPIPVKTSPPPSPNRSTTSPPPTPKPLPKPEPIVVPPSKPQEKPTPHTSRSLTASTVGTALFQGQRGSTEIERMFTSEYAGKSIEVHGTLRTWRSSNYDFVFGPGKYIKATIEVALENAAPFGRNSFQAIIQLPAETISPSIGKEVSYQGELIKVDGLMRQLYLRGE